MKKHIISAILACCCIAAYGQEEIEKMDTLSNSAVVAVRKLAKLEADRLTYDIEHDIDSRTMTVLEMLRKIPFVTVDAMDEIHINGSSSFLVYVDGKFNRLITSKPTQMFRSMPAANIKDICVILNPGAEYDAEGVGGVLKITTLGGGLGRRNRHDGLYGSLNAGASTDEKFDGGISMNILKGKWTLGADINASKKFQDNVRTKIEDQYGTSLLSSESGIKYVTGQQNGSLGASYAADSANLISASLTINRDLYSTCTTSDKTMLADTYSYEALESLKTVNGGIGASLDYQHSFRSKAMLTLSYQYVLTPQRKNAQTQIFNLIGEMPDPSRVVTCLEIFSEHTVQADFSTPLSSIGEISAGAKYIFRNMNADDSYNGIVSTYDNKSGISSAYGEFRGKAKSVGYGIGVRYEYTSQSAHYENDFSKRYGNLVPNASLQWNISQASNISISYNLRITRPDISHLNPFVNKTSTLSVSYGNPDLTAEQTHRLTFGYNLAMPKLMLSVRTGWRHCGNGIAHYSFHDGEILNNTWGNVLEKTNYGLNIFADWNICGGTRVFFSTDCGYAQFKSDHLQQQNQGWGGACILGFQTSLPWDIRTSGMVHSKSISRNLQGWNSGSSSANISFSKAFSQDRINVSILGSLVLFGKYLTREHSESPTFVRNKVTSSPFNSAGISFTWNFGKATFNTHTASRSINNNDKVLD